MCFLTNCLAALHAIMYSECLGGSVPMWVAVQNCTFLKRRLMGKTLAWASRTLYAVLCMPLVMYWVALPCTECSNFVSPSESLEFLAWNGL